MRVLSGSHKLGRLDHGVRHELSTLHIAHCKGRDTHIYVHTHARTHARIHAFISYICTPEYDLVAVLNSAPFQTPKDHTRSMLIIIRVHARTHARTHARNGMWTIGVRRASWSRPRAGVESNVDGRDEYKNVVA